MAVYKRDRSGAHWNYQFRVRGVRYRGAIPEAHTKWEAEQAELKLKHGVFEGRFGLVRRDQVDFSRNTVIATKTKGRKNRDIPMDLKTTMRYIRAVQLQRNVRSQNFGHILATQAVRPPVVAAVSS